MEEFDRPFGGGPDDRVVHALADRHGAHRLRAVGDALGHGHQVGGHAEALRGERLAGTAEAADHFVEHQQDAVRVADLAQPLQVALRRNQDAGRTGNRLDEAGSDILGTIEVDESHQVVGQLGACAPSPRTNAFSFRCVWRMCTTPAGRAEAPPVVDHAGERNTAEIDSVVRTFARDKHVATALAARLVVGECDFHRGVDRFRAGIDEENAVQVARRQLRNARRELERLDVAAQERRDEVKLAQLVSDRIGDLLAAMSGRAAEQARAGVDDLVSAVAPVIHAFGANDDLGVGLEFPVRRERHPVLIQRDLGDRQFVAQIGFGLPHAFLLIAGGTGATAGRRLGPLRLC